MSEGLARKTCTPCRGGIPPLAPEAARALLPEAEGWELTDGGTRIEKTFRFKDFAESFEFVKGVGELAESEFHHPVSVTFGWGFCAIVLQTKKIKGLHENDFIMAAKINRLAQR